MRSEVGLELESELTFLLALSSLLCHFRDCFAKLLMHTYIESGIFEGQIL